MGKIKVLKKAPGSKPVHCTINNCLTNLQAQVGGYIEAFYPEAGGVMIINEEGAVNGMKPNCRVDGVMLYGTILYAGFDDAGNFADCPLSWADVKKAYPEMFGL